MVASKFTNTYDKAVDAETHGCHLYLVEAPSTYVVTGIILQTILNSYFRRSLSGFTAKKGPLLSVRGGFHRASLVIIMGAGQARVAGNLLLVTDGHVDSTPTRGVFHHAAFVLEIGAGLN